MELGGFVFLLMIRDPAEGVRYGDLEEETDGGQGVAGETFEAEALDYGGCVCVKGALGAVVGEGDYDVEPETPVSKLPPLIVSPNNYDTRGGECGDIQLS